MSVLSLLIFLPIAFSVVILLLPENLKGYFKWITVGVTAVEFLLSIWVYLQFDQHTEGFQFLVQKDWITLPLGSLGVASIDYLIGVDGISMPMILLTGLVMFIGSISSFEIGQKEKAYYALYLLLTGSVIGCFVALDMFLFYLFFEFMLLPMYFLIGIWVASQRICFYQILYLYLGRLIIYFGSHDWFVFISNRSS
jgi:NADH-quinone oxidoreductase subunit M